MAKTIDLSGYPLASGNHSITVKACADGFDDSAASNAVMLFSFILLIL